MRRSPAVILSVSLLCMLCARPAAAGGAGEVTKSFAIEGFSTVSVAGGIGLELSKGSVFSVVLHADGLVAERIAVELQGSVLRIAPRGMLFARGRWLVHRARVEVIMPLLASLELEGGSEARIAFGIPDRDVTLSLSGGSLLSGTLSCRSLELTGTGGGAAELSGKAASVRLEASGGFSARLDSLEAVDLDARLSGGSSAAVNVRGRLTVTAKGGAGLAYRGSPRIERQELSGGAWLRSQ